ncbi:MAG TPA: glycosyltransferase family 1 protein [Anaerolineae bacterium]|nr:glycosyltransferase family 1 protein [Anaerolineae bacterium]
MRIGIDCTAAVYQRAGIGRYTRGIIGALAELGSKHSFVLMVAGSDGEPRESGGGLDDLGITENFSIKELPLRNRFWTVVWHRLRVPFPADLLTGTVDVFHSPDYLLPPLRLGKKVVTVHDLSFLRYPEGAEPSLRAYLSASVPRSIREADLILGDSESTRQDVIELLGVDRDRVEVVYPGVGQAFRVIGDQQHLAMVRELYGLDRPFILNVGTLEPRKNLATLLDAYAALRRRGGLEHRLVIAGGRGWLYDGVFRCAEELSLKENVLFLGYVAEEHLPALYCLADLLVFPSLYEGFGLPPLEAMACGTPVITSDSSSLPEVVGEAGLMVPAQDPEALAEAMAMVLADRGLREDLVRKGLSRASEFTWQAAGEKLLAIYQGLHEGTLG